MYNIEPRSLEEYLTPLENSNVLLRLVQEI